MKRLPIMLAWAILGATLCSAEPLAAPHKPMWYDTLKVSGYFQGRFVDYPDYPNVMRKTGGSNEFTVPRARLTVSAEPSPRTMIYTQIDVGSSKTTVKDAWAQITLDSQKAWRVRAGQQKVPFGFEVPQTDSDRLPLERSYMGQWAFPGNRDTGVVVFWSRPQDVAAFTEARKGDFGDGEYGTVALGFFNGQGNELEANSQKLFVVRAAQPFTLGGQYVEAGLSYYNGDYRSTATVTAGRTYDDELAGAFAYLAPRPCGLLLEGYHGEMEGGDASCWFATGIYRTGDAGAAFVRYDTYDGTRKGKGEDVTWDRDRWGVGYAYQIDERTRVTVEWDREQADASGSAAGYDNDQFGAQLQLTF